MANNNGGPWGGGGGNRGGGDDDDRRPGRRPGQDGPQIPEIEEMRSEFPADQFQILAVNLDQKEKKALRFLEKNPIGYPSAADPKGRLPVQFGVETMPTSYLIDGDGVIRYVHRGFSRGDGSKLREEIRRLLATQKLGKK